MDVYKIRLISRFGLLILQSAVGTLRNSSNTPYTTTRKELFLRFQNTGKLRTSFEIA